MDDEKKQTQSEIELIEQKAMLRILQVIRSPMSLMSIPNRTEALDLASKHNFSLEEFIQFCVKYTYKKS